MADDKRTDDEWTGSFKKPWLNPPKKHTTGATRGTWKWGMGIIVLAVVAVFVVLLLVDQDVLDRGWAYVVLPVAIIAAAASRVLTIFKASAEESSPGPEA